MLNVCDECKICAIFGWFGVVVAFQVCSTTNALVTVVPPKVVAIIPLYYEEEIAAATEATKNIDSGNRRIEQQQQTPKSAHLANSTESIALLQSSGNNESSSQILLKRRFPDAEVVVQEDNSTGNPQYVYKDKNDSTSSHLHHPQIPSPSIQTTKSPWSFKQLDIKPRKSAKNDDANEAPPSFVQHQVWKSNTYESSPLAADEGKQVNSEISPSQPIAKPEQPSQPGSSNSNSHQNVVIKINNISILPPNSTKTEKKMENDDDLSIQYVDEKTLPFTTRLSSSPSKQNPSSTLQQLKPIAHSAPTLTAVQFTNPAQTVFAVVDQSSSNKTASFSLSLECKYTKWSEWNRCSDTCGGCGKQDRTRTCLGKTDGLRCLKCEGPAEEVRSCNFVVCLYPRKPCCEDMQLGQFANQFACI